jgi:hypothetical protein
MARPVRMGADHTTTPRAKEITMVESLLATGLLVLILADLTAHVSRRRFQRAGAAFRCRSRTSGYTSASWPRLRRHWSRRMWAMWADDVLVVRRGPVLTRSVRLRAQWSPTSVYAVAPREVRSLGPAPIAVDLTIGDGSRIEVAADQRGRMNLVGPFLAAAVSALPRAPAPRSRS